MTFQSWGIADAMKPKIMPVKGVTVVGPLPKDIQKVTMYSAGLVAKATSVEAARAYIAYLMSPPVRPKFAAAGLDYEE